MKVSLASAAFVVLLLTASFAGAQSDALTGTWTGDWGPSETHRNQVTVELTWDGTDLTGVVNPGPDAIDLATASFDAATGMVKMTASAEGFRGTANYTIEGTIDGSEMSGSWNHDRGTGSLKITRQ